MSAALKAGQTVYVQSGLANYRPQFECGIIDKVGTKWFTVKDDPNRYSIETRLSDDKGFVSNSFVWLSQAEYENEAKKNKEDRDLREFYSRLTFSRLTDSQRNKALDLMADIKGVAE